MNRTLFLSILALDYYNRGYGSGIKNFPVGNQIGNATILNVDLPNGSVAAGFYGIAYDWNGSRVVMYRGTDNFLLPSETNGGGDVFGGYGVGQGSPYGPQARMAMQFYNAVAGRNPTLYEDGFGTMIVGGHSLGGGLAGLVGSLTGARMALYDPMPFSAAVTAAYDDARTQMILMGPDGQPMSTLQTEETTFITLTYGGVRSDNYLPWQPSTEGISGAYIPVAPDNVDSNRLDAYRLLVGSTATAGLQRLELPADTPLDSSERNLVGQRHAANLIVMRLFAETLGPDQQDWTKSAQYFFPALFDESIGLATGADTIDASGEDRSGAMRDAIAYSAIDEGVRPFGDTGIRALFDDADDLGGIASFLPGFIDDEVKGSIGSLIAEFAGLLAVNKVLSSQWSAAVQGVLAYVEGTSGKSLTINLTDQTWDLNGILEAVHVQVSANRLAETLITASFAAETLSAEAPGFVLSSLKYWLAGRTNTAEHEALGEIDWITLSGTSGVSFNHPPTENYSLIVGTDQAENRNTGTGPAIFLAAGGNDIVIGSAAADALLGGAGTDLLIGNGGNDWFYGDSGGDIIWGDAQNDYVGAAGHDTAVFGAVLGNTHVRYDGGGNTPGLRISSSYGTDLVYGVETVILDSKQTTFSIGGNIAAGTNLTIRASAEPGAVNQIIDAARMNGNGIELLLSRIGPNSTIRDKATNGTIQLEGFHTQIIGTYGNDFISDGSAEAKLIDAGRGNDYVNVAGTAASAVIFGGEGADQIIGSDAGDYIIDQEWGQAPSVQFWRDGTGLDPMAGSGSITSGAGDDTIIITRPQGALDGTSGLQNGYFVNPGTGNDWVKLSGTTGQLDYRYQRGDGLDVVQLHARSTLVYANAFEYAGELKQPYVKFDLRDYTSAQIAVTFETVRSRMVLEKLPNRDVLPVWELEGTITISLADGGRIELRDAVLLARSSSYGTYGVAPTGTFDIDYLRQNTFISIISPDETAIATSVPFELITADNAAMSLTITATAGNEAIKSAPASPAPAVVNTVPDGDQDVLLSPGSAAYFGGNGHDQLVVTWDLNALQSTLTDGVLTLSDKWGLITSTNLTAFDSVLVVSEDKVYSIADFHALLQTYGSEVQQIGSLGSDILDGLGGRNRLLGLAGDDRLTGQSGIDTLDGGPGKDKLAGFSGADILTGGAGADQFRYLFASDSGTGANADRITDFLSGTDRLNFALLDADPVAAGRQALSFIDTAAFSATGTAQVRYGALGADLLVQVDLDGNGTSDMEIVLAGAGGQVLAGGDFML